ncbi:MAG: Flp family type IVb pilin [Alphaproteobacteria bacterium]|nr:Flp family type IVb pilin [Alphaproteobacteria bacterium]
MTSTLRDLRAFYLDEAGATSIEYALIATVVSVGIIASLQYFTSSLNNLWNYVSSTITGSMNS